jgi:hypothetical protein
MRPLAAQMERVQFAAKEDRLDDKLNDGARAGASTRTLKTQDLRRQRALCVPGLSAPRRAGTRYAGLKTRDEWRTAKAAAVESIAAEADPKVRVCGFC